MKYLITGATGFIGSKIVAELLKNGHQVSVLGRSADKVKKIFGDTVTFFSWEPENGQVPTESFDGVHCVIHLAGQGIADKRWSSQQKRRIYDSRILGTRNLVTAIKNVIPESLNTFISASAIGYYGDRGDETLNENSPPGNDFLAKVCRDWEIEAMNIPKTIRVVCLRTGIVLGSDGGALKKLLPLFRLGLGGPVGTGKQWMSWIHVNDLVRLFIETSHNSTYEASVNGVAPTPLTNRDFSTILGKVLHRPAFMPAPALALKLAMGELSVLVLSSQKVLPKKAEQNTFSFTFPTLESALEDIVNKG